MKRGCYLLLLIILLPLMNAATNQETGISVSVVSYPFVEIVSPQNISYQEGDYILLEYSSNLIDTVWYNLDNTTNITINTSFYFQADLGEHTLYLYGNQSNGTILSDEVTFTVIEIPPTGGGGGGAKAPKEVAIEEEMIKEEVSVALKQGETKEIKLLIKNELDKESKIRINDLNLEDLLTKISDIEFYLKPGEAREVTFTFHANENKTPELYIEKISIETEDSEKQISFYVEVESLDFLFDVVVEIPEYPKTFSPGGELSAIIDFYNLGKQGEVEVNIEYLIKDEEGEIIFGEKQSLIISPSIRITKKLQLPENIPEGNYIFYVKVTYDSKTAIASKGFKVGELETTEIIGTVARNIKEDIGEIAAAVAILSVLGVALTSLEHLFAGKGISNLLKGVRKKSGFREYKKRIHKKIK